LDPGPPRHLLTPTLQGASVSEPILSFQALFLTAFFGGPVAIGGLAAWNSRFFGRGQRDLVLGAVMACAYMGLSGFILVTYWDQLEDGGALGRATKWLDEGWGLAMLGVYWLLNRDIYRADQVSGRENRPAWKPALLAILGGFVVDFLVAMVVVSTTGLLE